MLAVALVASPTWVRRFVAGFGSFDELAAVAAVAAALVPTALGLRLSEPLGSPVDLVTLGLPLPSCCFR